MVGLKQEFRQSQQLVMTHQLQQSIKLLQLSAVELQEYIDEELEKNPLLTKEDAENDAPAEAGDDEHSGAEASGDEDDIIRNETREIDVSDKDYSVAESLEEGAYGEEWTQGDTVSIGEVTAGAHGAAGGYEHDGEGSGIEGASAREQTLSEHLLEQIHMDIADAGDQLIAEHLTDMLDDAGYLREDTSALAETLGVKQSEIDAVLVRLQQMDPPGVFARSLAECLRLQLQDMNRLDPVMEIFLENLEMMGSGELKALQKKSCSN